MHSHVFPQRQLYCCAIILTSEHAWLEKHDKHRSLETCLSYCWTRGNMTLLNANNESKGTGLLKVDKILRDTHFYKFRRVWSRM